jgi:hypothetical protein
VPAVALAPSAQYAGRSGGRERGVAHGDQHGGELQSR